MLTKLLLAIAEDLLTLLFGLPWKRWAIVASGGVLLATATLYCNGWFEMVQIWSFPWRTMPYVQIEWVLLPSAFHILSTMIGLWCAGSLVVMTNRIGRDW